MFAYFLDTSLPVLLTLIRNTYQDMAVFDRNPCSVLNVPQNMELRELQCAQHEPIVQEPLIGIISIGRVIINSGDLRSLLEIEAKLPKLFKNVTKAKTPAEPAGVQESTSGGDGLLCTLDVCEAICLNFKEYLRGDLPILEYDDYLSGGRFSETRQGGGS